MNTLTVDPVDRVTEICAQDGCGDAGTFTVTWAHRTDHNIGGTLPACALHVQAIRDHAADQLEPAN